MLSYTASGSTVYFNGGKGLRIERSRIVDEARFKKIWFWMGFNIREFKEWVGVDSEFGSFVESNKEWNEGEWLDLLDENWEVIKGVLLEDREYWLEAAQ